MTRNAERAYVKRWIETAGLLDELRWTELRGLDDARALQASRDLIQAALLAPLPRRRREWSGLVDQQDALHGRRRNQTSPIPPVPTPNRISSGPSLRASGQGHVAPLDSGVVFPKFVGIFRVGHPGWLRCCAMD